MSAGAPPIIFPVLPINIPGNQGTVLLSNGIAQVQQAQQIVPLATKTGGGLTPPVVSPPVTRQLVTNG